MKRIFEPRGYFTVPDGTDVSPFLNARDSNQSDVPWYALGDMGIASGRIKPGVASWIHCHPVVTQVTYVVSGELTVHMKAPQDSGPYFLDLRKGQAAVTEPGTYFQLQNKSDDGAEVLYLSSPAFVFEMNEEQVLYNDAVLIAKSWDKLELAEFNKEINIKEVKSSRAESKHRLAKRKGVILQTCQ